MKRKLLSIALVLAVAFTFMPFLPDGQVAAIETQMDTSKAITTSAELAAYINENGGICEYNEQQDYVTLKGDFVTAKAITFYIEPNTEIGLYMDGFNIISTAPTTDRGAIWVEGGGTLSLLGQLGEADVTTEGKELDAIIASDYIPCIYAKNSEVDVTSVEFKLYTDSYSYAIAADEGAKMTLRYSVVYSETSTLVASDKADVFAYSCGFFGNEDEIVYVCGNDAEVSLFFCGLKNNLSEGYALYVDGKAEVNLLECTTLVKGGCVYAEEGTVEIEGGTYTTDDLEADYYYDVIDASKNALIIIGGGAKINGTYGVYCYGSTSEENCKVLLKRCTITSRGGEYESFGFPTKYSLQDMIHQGYFIPTLSSDEIVNGEYSVEIYRSPLTVYACPKTAKLSAKSFFYDGKAHTPKITVKDTEGVIIPSKYYAVKYSKATRKAVGKYKVTVTFKDIYKGNKSLTAYYKIVPKTPAIKSMTVGTKKLTVKASTKPTAKGGASYQIAYRVKGTKTWKYTTTTTASKVIKNLKKGKVYQVKMRTVKTVNKVKYYSAWTKTKYTKKIK